MSNWIKIRFLERKKVCYSLSQSACQNYDYKLQITITNIGVVYNIYSKDWNR